MKRFLLLTVIFLACAACLGTDFADSLQGSWTLVSGTVDGEEIPILAENPITLTLEGDRASGVAACNSYSGTFDLSGSEITFSDMAITEMACFPDELMQAESLYTQALTRVDSVALDGQLTLSGDGVELVFDYVEPTPDAELTNTVWVLEGLIAGDAVSTPVLDSRGTIEFFTDGSILGNTGCRGFSTGYTLSGDEVSLTDDLNVQGPECESDLADQDSHFLATIEHGFAVDIEGDRLTISGHDDQGLAFVAEP